MRIVVSMLAISFVLLIGCRQDDAKTATSAANTADSLENLPGEPIGDRTPVSKPSGLQIIDLAEGTGEVVPLDRPIAIHYTGYLRDSGQKFDDSRTKNIPHRIILNFPGIIPAWREGFVGMKTGGRRKLIVPPKLAFGQIGRPPVVPANATVVFDIEVLSIMPLSSQQPGSDSGAASAPAGDAAPSAS